MTDAELNKQVKEQMIELAVQGGISREKAEADFNNPSKLTTCIAAVLGTAFAIWFWVWLYTSPNVVGAVGAVFLIGGLFMVVIRVLAWGFTGSTKL